MIDFHVVTMSGFGLHSVNLKEREGISSDSEDDLRGYIKNGKEDIQTFCANASWLDCRLDKVVRIWVRIESDMVGETRVKR